jgi:ABC-2 type transport system ATP-binding protein
MSLKRDLTKVYSHKTVLDHVNFKIRQGSIMGLVGQKRGGQNDLDSLLTDVAHPTSGTYAIMGESDPKKLVRFRANIAAMVETPALYLSMSAHDNLYTRCILDGGPAERHERLYRWQTRFRRLGFFKTAKNTRRIFRLASGNA